MNWKSLFAMVTAALALVTGRAEAGELEKVLGFGPVGAYNSQYSPWVMHQPGWGSYLMYYCKNTPDANNVWADRIWRIESWTGGKTQWVNDQLVIQGTATAEDQESCSPGVVIDTNQVWHMYYVTAGPSGALHLYHATASAPGISWVRRGEISLPSNVRAYLETPSPMMINGKLVVYFIGSGDQTLYRMESWDGYNFTWPVRVNAPWGVSHGRVTYKNGVYYYVYSRDASSFHAPPTQISVATSTNGVDFTPVLSPVMSSNGTSWDGSRMWSPHMYVQDNGEFWIYYAGNLGSYSWWGSNSSIGLRRFTYP